MIADDEGHLLPGMQRSQPKPSAGCGASREADDIAKIVQLLWPQSRAVNLTSFEDMDC
jgi:hypothetical protein